jgi:hypothetical protein
MGSRYLGHRLLAVAIGLAVMSGLARAQEPIPVTKSAAAPTVGTPPYTNYAPPIQEQPSSSWLHAHLNRQGHHCAATVGSYGCGSWRADCVFAFGSCRAFFGEPCFPEGPLNHQGQGAGYQADGRGSCGCR